MKKANRNKDQALFVLATTPNYTEAAQKLGVTPPTIYEWLKDPEFAKSLLHLNSIMCFPIICFSFLNVRHNQSSSLNFFKNNEPLNMEIQKTQSVHFVPIVPKKKAGVGNERDCCHLLRRSAPGVHHGTKMAVIALAVTA